MAIQTTYQVAFCRHAVFSLNPLKLRYFCGLLAVWGNAKAMNTVLFADFAVGVVGALVCGPQFDEIAFGNLEHKLRFWLSI